jgi:hypothetical protein
MKLGMSVLAIPALGFALQVPEKPKPPEPLKHGPLAYYKDHCARCHGDLGGAYPDDFTKDKTFGDMRDVIKSMAAGQGGAPLTEENELLAQIAFHYSIDLKKPFLDWTGQKGPALSGEVTPDAKVTGEIDGVGVPVSVDKGVWTVTASDLAAHQVVIKATVGHSTATLDLSKAAFSQAVPPSK